MKQMIIVLLAGLVGLALQAADTSKPNIILILVDDMGYSDIGCYGGEIKTPHIDRLAEDGLRFTSMYNTGKCFLSRACLLTGVYAQQCNMGRSSQGGIQKAITIAELLKAQGYRTLAVGKHHSTVSLYERGFDRFYGFHYGEGKSCANHFNPGQQRPGEGIPARKKGESRTYCFDDKKMIPYYTPEESDWYTTDYFTHWALEFLDDHQHEDKPYFLYLSYTAPHDPLHAWPEDIAKYRGTYEVGYESIRSDRFKRQKAMGLFGPNVRLSQPSHRPWNSLSAEQRQDQARRMQVYAAMIDRIDQNVGRLLERIRETDESDNTLILFASDNGCSAESVNTGTGEIGALTRWASLQKDWANVSNAPFRYYKNFSYEGGIRTPFIVHWPKIISKPGSINRQPVHFVDVMATLQDITGASYPNTIKGQDIPPMQGESLLPAIRGSRLPIRKEPIFFEYAAGGAVRNNRWKLVTKSLPRPLKEKATQTITWELYDLDQDLTETADLSHQHPNIAQRLGQLWRTWYRESYGL